jgi:minimal PKS acyl carrier protein
MAELTLDGLKTIMSSCSGADEASEVTPEVAGVEFGELGYDSLAVLEMVTHIQRQYRITIPDEAVEEITSPTSLIDYVNQTLSGV